jgi:hypothetical protein
MFEASATPATALPLTKVRREMPPSDARVFFIDASPDMFAKNTGNCG